MFIFLYISFALMLCVFALRYYEQKKLIPKQYLISERIIHWGSFLLVLGLIFTAVMNVNYYSKEEIMKSFDFSMPVVGLNDVDLDSLLFIARYERRIVWDHHFIMGVMLIALTIPWIVSHMLRVKKSNFVKITFWSYVFLISILAFTGIVLHIGNWVDVDYDFRETCRDIHHYSYYGLLVWFVSHILLVVKLVIKSKKDIIGKMIHGGKEINKDIKDINNDK